jgi:twinkle protein
MGKSVELIEHVECGSSRLQVFQQDDGSYNGWCYGCSTFVKDPYKEHPEGYVPTVVEKSPEDIQRELEEFEEYTCVGLRDRKLSAETLSIFGIKTGLDPVNGATPITHHYPYYKDGELVAYKNRVIQGKKLWSVGAMKDVDMFGWHLALATGSPRLFITEGELDAVSLYAILKKKSANTQWADREPAVVSLPKGASGAAKEIAKNLEKIDKNFKEVVLVLDQDEAGQRAVEDILTLAPHFMTVDLPAKDANECLVKGHINATANACLFKAAIPKNTRIVWGSSMHEAARQEAVMGHSWPWPSLTKLTRGIRFGETIYIGAGVKMGKSEVVNALAAHFIQEHGWKVFMAKPEEANRKTYQMVVGKIAGKIFHDPDLPFDYEAFDKASPVVGDNLAMLDLYQHMGWESLRADIKLAALNGCKAIFIDPITNLTAGMDSGKANEVLQGIATELSAMAHDLDIVIFIFCHLRAPDHTPHERGGKVLSTQFAGSRSMMRSCNLMIGIEGDKDPDLSDNERNLRDLVLLEDREFGSSGRVGLFWNPLTAQFTEV